MENRGLELFLLCFWMLLWWLKVWKCVSMGTNKNPPCSPHSPAVCRNAAFVLPHLCVCASCVYMWCESTFSAHKCVICMCESCMRVFETPVTINSLFFLLLLVDESDKQQVPVYFGDCCIQKQDRIWNNSQEAACGGITRVYVCVYKWRLPT